MKLIQVIKSLLLFNCSAASLLAQPGRVQVYNVESGLVNNNIQNIYSDSRGFIWICTLGGLSRFDGSRFSNYTMNNGLTSDMINDITETAPQEFIVAQNMNGPRLLKNGQLGPLPEGCTTTIDAFYRKGDRLLATTDYQGILQWEKDRFKPVNADPPHTVSRMGVINDSTWMVLAYQVSIRLTDAQTRPLSPLYYLDATTIFTDSRQFTWVGTGHGLRLLDPQQPRTGPLRFISLPEAFDIPVIRKSFISSFLEDSQHNYWVGTYNGLVLLQPGKPPVIYTLQQGLPVLNVTCLHEDSLHNLWIGTQNGVVKLALRNDSRSFSLNLGVAHDGTVLLLPLNKDTLRVFDGKYNYLLGITSGELFHKRAVGSPGCRLFRLGNEQLLVTNRREGYIFSRNRKRAEKIKWPAMTFDVVTRLDSEHFLAARFNRLFIVCRGAAIEKKRLPVESMIAHLTPVNDHIVWAGSMDGGLTKMKIHTAGQAFDISILDTLMGRLPDAHIRALTAGGERTLWIGTRYRGVLQLKERPEGGYLMQQYGIAQGLSSGFVRTLKMDNAANVWVGTMQGMDKLVPVAGNYHVFNFGKLHSFFSATYDICLLDSDELIATGPIMMRARDGSKDTLPPPPVYITNINSTRDTVLPYNEAQIYFEFSAPQFINEVFTAYSYRLKGSSDRDWTMAGKFHSVYFASLKPGQYTFEVRAQGFNGHWGAPAIYSFSVASPFWQKTWFQLLVIAGMLAIAYALYRYRTGQLIRLQQVRNRIATDLHDEIGSNLTNISILSSLGKKQAAEKGADNNFLQRISEEVAASSQALDDIVWSVNTHHDSLEETVARMRRYAAELFDAGGTQYELCLDPAVEGKKLSMEQRRDIYLLYKEAVNNIFKHAAATMVHIQVNMVQQQLQICVQDNGRGFDNLPANGRHGMQGMKERVKRWKGTIHIISAPSKGVSIRVLLPLAG